MNAAARTRWTLEKAREVGFDLCGIAPVSEYPELQRLPEWLARGYAGEMQYLHNPRRRHPDRLLEGARSLVVVALNYNTAFPSSTSADLAGCGRAWISRYAWGDDYHEVLRHKLDALLHAMRLQFQEPFDARPYVDTGPVLERVAAKYAGLGWLAKNTCLINQQLGSWLFLGAVITSLELDPTVAPHEPPPSDLCGTCRRCIDACPTQAIVAPYVLDARRCISYLTIELRGAIPNEFRSRLDTMVFGCDICQDVCPWNHKAPATTLAAFQPRTLSDASGGAANHGAAESLLSPSLEWLLSLDEQEYRKAFRASPVKRAKWRGLLRNACVAAGNARLTADSPALSRIISRLEALAGAADAIVAEHARWALRGLADSRAAAPATPPNAHD